MIDFKLLMARAMLKSVTTRAANEAQVYDIAEGDMSGLSSTLKALLPPPANGDLSAQAEQTKILALVQSTGPEIMGRILDGVVGSVNWGGTSDKLDSRLKSIDLKRTARVLVRRLMISGFAAARAYKNAAGETALEPLGGYVVPITDPYNALNVIGIYQAMMSNSDTDPRWRVRVYDFDTKTMRQWDDLKDPTTLAAPSLEFATPMPHYALLGEQMDGLTQGPFWVNSPTILSECVNQVYIYRAARRAGYPMTSISGNYNALLSNIGPGGVVFFTDAEGQVQRVAPGDLSQMFDTGDRILERLRIDFRLPGALSRASNAPSGEALREANISAFQFWQSLAGMVSSLLTGAVEDFCALATLAPVDVVITPNRESLRTQMIADVMALRAAKLLPPAVAAREIQPFFGTYSDEELNKWVALLEVFDLAVANTPAQAVSP